MPSKASIGKAFRLVRKYHNKTQEDFDLVSSRTFVSSVERGLKSPTVEKLSQLCESFGEEAVTVLLVAHLLERKSNKAPNAEQFANLVKQAIEIYQQPANS